MGRAATREEKAHAVVAAVTHGDRVAAERAGISVRSLERWRAELSSDPDVAALVVARRARAVSVWSDKLDAALSASCDFIERAAEVLDPADAGAVRAMTKALGTLAEVQQRKRILDERLGE